MLTAWTREIDDIETSAAEILGRLTPGGRLLRHSVGILTFHPEFLESGAVRAVSKALPFVTAGGTTSASGVPGERGDLMLTAAVLTSDDVEFRAGAVLLGDDPRAAIQGLYAELVPRSAEKPSLLLTIAPVREGIGGDDFIEALDAVSGGIPLFGGLAATPQPDLRNAAVCMNGEHQTDLFTLIAVFGAIRPEFYHTAVPDDRVIQQNAVITRSEKYLIQSIDGLTALDYLESVGLAENGDVSGIASIPFVLTTSDGARLVRSIHRATKEGHLVAFGAVPQGARVGFADCDAECVLHSARESIGRVLAASGGRNALIVTCDARRWILGMRPAAEMQEIGNCLDHVFPYLINHARGEFCPVRERGGRLVNSFQNFSMIACRLDGSAKREGGL
jgi:hypothetical protein